VNRHENIRPENVLPDAFDRALSTSKDRPDVVHTKASTIRTMPVLGVGGSQLYVVQTLRAPENGDTIFLECYGADGQHRLVLPAAVADAIARQRESLTTKSRSKAARKVAEDRAARGERPAFLRKKR
jgi:hypothetical protein